MRHISLLPIGGTPSVDRKTRKSFLTPHSASSWYHFDQRQTAPRKYGCHCSNEAVM